jgi:hypothetical protein
VTSKRDEFGSERYTAPGGDPLKPPLSEQSKAGKPAEVTDMKEEMVVSRKECSRGNRREWQPVVGRSRNPNR